MHINGRIAAEVLATNVASARMKRDWTQNDLALQLKSRGLYPAFVGKVERAEIKFRDPSTIEKVQAICGLLKIDIPYETEAERNPQPPQKVVQLHPVPQPPEPQQQPEKKSADPEVIALATCASALAKIEDGSSRARVISYLMDRFAK